MSEGQRARCLRPAERPHVPSARNPPRQTFIDPQSDQETEFYGLLGDVEVIRRALTSAELAEPRPAARIDETTPGVYVGINFDPATGTRLAVSA